MGSDADRGADGDDRAGDRGAAGSDATSTDATAADPSPDATATPDPLPDADRDAADLLDALEAARTRHEDAEAAVAEHGADALREVSEAVREADRLLNSYEDSATGTGDFKAYVRFQGEFADVAEGFDDDRPGSDALERANEAVDGRRLSDSDFERAREALAPARELAARLDEREDAEAAVSEAERDVNRRIDALDDRIADLERLVDLGEADLDAPTDELREPIAAYNDAVRDALDDFRREASAREFLAFVAEAAETPFVDYDAPPSELREYLENAPTGAEPIPDLLDYVDYSASKLDHYVDDPGTFTARVRPHRTYLERLSAEPLTVAWPPPPAGTLRFQRRELVSLTAKFAPESVVARARALREVADHPEYRRLRRAAEAEAELSDAEVERVAAGEAAAELRAARARRAALRAALAGEDAAVPASGVDA
ncbi:hypothetical protein Hbl1158_01160 [Halobaculum sp. CBA1158]|uniref:DUF7118 family protein n=1 Tax=Halobaculum sp. CBA1158 TaxID=2904243 RepID=UPI001F2A7F2C|nr:hypothetical protein [Halobaculum sp. CBA1158]UIP00010.1 hypothetical protein Hbl1158_01160 [Halobaculum sp. CBA1158]